MCERSTNELQARDNESPIARIIHVAICSIINIFICTSRFAYDVAKRSSAPRGSGDDSAERSRSVTLSHAFQKRGFATKKWADASLLE